MNFMVCISRQGFGEFSTDDLTLGRLYEIVEAKPSSQVKGMIRVIDDSGEAYCYPTNLFAPVDMPGETADRLHQVLAA